jgi:nucleotide-binding universal stress UspA family protein
VENNKTILVPTDFSKRAENALNQAIYLAKETNSRLDIYHFYHRPVVEKDGERALAELEEKIDLKFQDLLRVLPELKQVPYEFKKVIGTTVEKITGRVNTGGVNALVMATKGAKGFNEIWGTKTAKIIKMIEKPAFVIPDNTSLKNLKKVALACDYSLNTNYEAIKFLTYLAEKLDFSIDVVTLNREEKTMTNAEHKHRNQIIELMDNVKASFKFTQHPQIDKGIMDYAKDNNVDAVAILSKNYSFIESLFHESLTEKMVFNSPIPLMVI